ncbi:hypothetical protein ACC817_30720 [Rhizobium ruizarguesonis]|uniref:hypothetical protein n=1 Tax=Rhizobium ruizarguesonis TaxID=2081791 RepID=UPI001FDED5E5|nr:hypothetical protein [Rhizobium ruizarguesonis]
MKAGLATFLGVVLMVSSAMAQDRVAEVFTNTCLARFPDFKNIDTARYAPFMALDADPLAPPGLPLITSTRSTVWLVGSPTKKSPDDFALQVSEGTFLERPARGCLVAGIAGDTSREEALLTHFQTNQFIGETKQSLLPGYRYWLVERGGQKALFGISQIGGAFGAASATLALVVPDPDVAQQFADMLANEKKNQAPEN